MKKVYLYLIFSLLAFSALAEDIDFDYKPLPPSRVETWIGPRFGFTFHPLDSEQFSKGVQRVPWSDENKTYRPILSQFGFVYEKRYLLGRSDIQFAMQGNAIIGGLDQNTALPTLAVLFGMRVKHLEVAVGPNMGVGGFNVVYAAGYTFTFSDVYIPLNFTFQAGSAPKYNIYGIFTGVNLRTR